MNTLTKEEAVALFEDDVAARAAKIQAFVMDQTQSYEDRLEVWQNTPTHLQNKHHWVWHHPTIKDDDWMHYDWWNRGQEIDLTDLADYQEWDDEKTKEFYLGCMNEGVWAFCFDW